MLSRDYYAIKKTRAALRALLTFSVLSISVVLLVSCTSGLIAILSQDLNTALVQGASESIHALIATLSVWSLFLPIVVYFGTKYSSKINGLSGGTVVLAVCIFAISMTLRGLQFPLCIDDAYIDFRYVHNFLTGYGLTFQNCFVNSTSTVNPLGISSPLHIFLLTVVNQLFSGFDVAAISRAVNLFLDGCNLLLLFVLVLLLSGRGAVALSAMVIYGLSDYTIGEVVRGKEAPLLVMLMLGYLIFAAAKMPRARATVAGLFALTRPEGILVLASDFVYQVCRGKGIAQLFRQYLYSIICLVVTSTILFVYFGGVVPSGMVAKWIIYDRPPYFGFAQLGEYLARNIFGISLVANNDGLAYLLSFALYFLLLSVATRLLWSKLALRGYLISLYVLGLFFGGLNAVIFPFPWYFAWWSLLPALVWSHWAQVFAPNKKRIFYATAFGVMATVGLWSQTAPGEYWFNLKSAFGNLPLPIFKIDTMQGRLPAYIEAAEYVNKLAKKGDLVACSELGVLGYTLHDVRILDLHGIISPEMLELYKQPGRVVSKDSLITFPAAFASRLKPDWIITYDIFVRESLFKDSYFAQNYHLVKVYPYNFFDSQGLFVYARN
ncbi:MAG: hypothetical protein IPP97_00340 [Candidatus Obscuribacter sp.]|nr:hypothetical protein [Candidatus Obscuribacter sp.]